MPRRATCIHLLAIVLLAAAMRTVYLAEMHGSPVFELLLIDEQAYDEQAMRMVSSGDWIGTRVFYQDPLYPYLLGLFYKTVGHQVFLARVVQAAIGVLNCVVLYLLARELFDPRVALVAGLLAAVYRPFYFEESFLLKSAVEMISINMALLLLFVGRARRSWPLHLIAGLVLGLGTLVRGNYLLFAPIAVLWIALSDRPAPLTRRAARAAVFAAGFFAMILPVTVRNYVVGHDFVLTTAQAGTNFYIGNHPGNTTGTLVTPPFVHTIPAYEEDDFRREAERRTDRTDMKPSEVSEFWFRQGVDSIIDSPARFLLVSWRRLRCATNNYEPPDNQSVYFVGKFFAWSVWLNPITFGVVFPFACAGIVFAARRRSKASVFYLFLAVYLASLMLFYVFARSRLPLLGTLIVFAAFGGVCFFDALRNLLRPAVASDERAATQPAVRAEGQAAAQSPATTDERSSREAVILSEAKDLAREPRLAPALPAAVVALVAGALWSWWPTDSSTKTDFATPWWNLGTAYATHGRWDEAEAACHQALRQNPNMSMAYFGLGTVRVQREKLQEAEEMFRKAVELDNGNWEAHVELGALLRTRNQFAESERELHTALAIYPYAPATHLQLGLTYLAEQRVDRAVTEYQKAIALNPNYADAHYYLGRIYYLRNDRARARDHLRKALEAEPDSPSAKQIRQMLQKLGE